MSIRDRAVNLADYLPTIGLGVNPTIFVCHSLGGIIVKEIIRCSALGDASNDLVAKTIGIVFLGTPHAGADLAKLGSFFRSKLTFDLEGGSSYISGLRNWFSEFAEKSEISLSNYLETQRYGGFIVVSEAAGALGCKNVKDILLDANHSNISKPNSPNDDIFIRIKRDVEKAMRKTESTAKAISSIDGIIALLALTNQMYFDVINKLHRIFSEKGVRAIIISNPCAYSKPCSIIITQDPSCRLLLKPLEERFPDRFAVQIGVLAEFTSGDNEKLAKRGTIRRKKQYSEVNHVKERLIGLLAKKALDAMATTITIETKASTFVRQKSNLFIYTTLHSIENNIRSNVERECHLLMDNLLSGRTETSELDVVLKAFLSWGSEDRNSVASDCIADMINVVREQNHFNIKLWDFSTEDFVPETFNCKIRRVDPSKDIAVFMIKLNVHNNNVLRKWADCNITYSALNEEPSVNFGLSSGEAYSSPIAKGKRLKLQSTDTTTFFVLSDKVTSLSSLLLFEGAVVENGSSGAPILDSCGKVVAMIVGRTW